jgi:hypothetical protein
VYKNLWLSGVAVILYIDDSTAKRSSHREAREDRKENAKPQIIIQDNLRDGLTFSKRS